MEGKSQEHGLPSRCAFCWPFYLCFFEGLFGLRSSVGPVLCNAVIIDTHIPLPRRRSNPQATIVMSAPVLASLRAVSPRPQHREDKTACACLNAGVCPEWPCVNRFYYSPIFPIFCPCLTVLQVAKQERSSRQRRRCATTLVMNGPSVRGTNCGCWWTGRAEQMVTSLESLI